MYKTKRIFFLATILALLLIGCRQTQENLEGQTTSPALNGHSQSEHDAPLLFFEGKWTCISESEFTGLKSECPASPVRVKIKGTLAGKEVNITVKSAQQRFAWEREVALSAVYQGGDGGEFKHSQKLLVQPRFEPKTSDQMQEALKRAFGYEACYTIPQLPIAIVFDSEEAVQLMFAPAVVQLTCLVEHVNGQREEVVVDWPIHDDAVANGVYYAKGRN